MTQATPETAERHDTLTGVTGRSGRGTARQTIRVDEALWDRFAEAATVDESDRSAVLREFIRWYIREPGAKMPRRPDAKISGNKLGTNQGDER
jgi:hypothetical protein